MSYYGRPNPVGLENMGKPWKKEEVDQLLREINENKDYETIAIAHKRKSGGIISRLRQVAAELHLDEKKTIDECIEITGLDKSDVLDAIDKHEYNERAKKRAAEIKAQVKAKEISVLDPVAELCKDVNELKKDVKEILRLMNALYDFEASQS
jgi:myo-inositol-1-phosphate synthase